MAHLTFLSKTLSKIVTQVKHIIEAIFNSVVKTTTFIRFFLHVNV